ncbi:MAG: radical SAM protein [Gemmatimonadota bacterium]|nr:MAG: radical SAM protein [Gemmatimonadota bacterium]
MIETLLNDCKGARIIDANCNIFDARRLFQSLMDRDRDSKRAGITPKDVFEVPLKVHFEYTSQCNMDCLFCYNTSSTSREQGLDTDEIVRTIEEMAVIGVMEVGLSGGEVFCDQKLLLRIIKMLNDHSIAISIKTNGWFLNERTVEKLSPYTFQSIDVSIDGSSETVHDRMRAKPGSWRKAIHALKLLKEAGVYSKAACLVTGENVESLEDYIDLCFYLGAKEVMFTPCIMFGRAAQNKDRMGLTEQQFEEASSIIVRKHLQYRGFMKTYLALDFGYEILSKVLLTQNSCVIRSDGSVHPSCLIPISFGNIRDQKLKDIWNSGLNRLLTKKEVQDFVSTLKFEKTATLRLLRTSLTQDVVHCYHA